MFLLFNNLSSIYWSPFKFAFSSTSIRKTIHKTTQSHIILNQNKITLLEIQNLKFKLAVILVSGDVEVKREPHERFNFMELLLRKKNLIKRARREANYVHGRIQEIHKKSQENEDLEIQAN